MDELLVEAGEALRPITIIDADRVAARQEVKRAARTSVLIGGPFLPVGLAVAALVASVVAGNGVDVRQIVVFTLIATALLIPAIAIPSFRAQRDGFEMLAERVATERTLRGEARMREFETRLTNALEMGETEADAVEVARLALDHVVPGSGAELLMADSSNAHLRRAVVNGPDDTWSGCPVESPNRCPAVRRGQTQLFPDSRLLDACPKLRRRGPDACAAVCVPLSIAGRGIGVLHVATPARGGEAPRLESEAVRDLEVVAQQVGGRLGMIRMMAESQLQAATDPLTGLANRRSFENGARALRDGGVDFALVLLDLDHFKTLNDTHGHESGDRALRVLADVLRVSVRPDDLVCRHGGEEFAIALARAGMREAIEACERIRSALTAAVKQAGVPGFTASFGVTVNDGYHDSLADMMARADEALYRAKQRGRDRIVANDPDEGVSAVAGLDAHDERATHPVASFDATPGTIDASVN